MAAELILRQLGLPRPPTEQKEEGGIRNAEVLCCVLQTLTGTWRHSVSGLLLSGAAAACLVSEGVLSWDDLDMKLRIAKDDWYVQERLLGSGIRALSRVTGFLVQVAGLVWLLVACVVNFEMPRTVRRHQASFSRRDGAGVASAFGRLERIRQANCDLAVVLEHLEHDGEPVVSLGLEPLDSRDGILTRWNKLSAAASNQAFSSANVLGPNSFGS